MKLRSVGLIFACALGLSACSLAIHTSGSVVKLNNNDVTQAVSVDQVVLYIDKPEQAYDVVAMVQASADVIDYSYIADYDAAVLEQLRAQAASVGATGVISIVREVVSGGAVLTTNTYGTGWILNNPADTAAKDALVQYRSTDTAHLSQNYTLYVRGQAIRFK